MSAIALPPTDSDGRPLNWDAWVAYWQHPCRTLRNYTTEQAALSSAVRVGGLAPYRCETCGEWHLQDADHAQ